uniref:Uncharacterized protein n=1 Tax=Callorhinchus milii TaxID=7868 RepID=A0A4W3JU42_CALMI
MLYLVEKAIQFIQLEKLYHQTLLANLSAIQDHWGMTTEAAQSGIAVEKGCKIASTLCTAESSLEVQRETARAKGRVHPDNKAECLDSENTVTDKSCFQPDATAPCEDMLTAAKPIKTEGFSDEAEVVTNTTPFFHAGEIENLHHDLKSAAIVLICTQNTPPEGLVSILKKRSLNQEILRVHQKSSKRRVRFQDPEDVLDQVSADSCLLLVLLCIITVFLSVGGTALYCTFGDLDSSVCRDFTAQMDFYYAQFQQSFEKAKHWLLFS